MTDTHASFELKHKAPEPTFGQEQVTATPAPPNKQLLERLRAALKGELLVPAEVLAWFNIPTHSLASAQIIWAANVMARELSGSTGQVFAQIGVDGGPCPGNCQYCNYAAINSANVTSSELPKDEIIGYAKAFTKAGAHLVSLMATVAYDFDRYCELGAFVRETVGDTPVLLANVGDMTFNQAQRLKSAGFDAFYHAVRMGEGTLTNLDPAVRRETINNGKQAGLKLMSGIEPLFAELPDEDVVKRIFETAALEALASGVCSIHAVKGTKMEGVHPLSRARLRHIGALGRLATGPQTLFGFVGHTIWVDTGADPRGRQMPTDHALLVERTIQAREDLVQAEWLVANEPLKVWKD